MENQSGQRHISSSSSSEPEVFGPILGPRRTEVGPQSNLVNGNGRIVLQSPSMETLESLLDLMKYEVERLKTFAAWSVPFISAADLAKAGFFYLLNGDRVQCAFCKVIVCGWEAGDVPMDEHKRHSPCCSFVVNPNGCGNITLTQNSKPNLLAVLNAGQDVCGNKSFELLGRSKSPPNPLKLLGVQPHHGPKHQMYASNDARIRSFKHQNWIEKIGSTKINSDKLAEAGFFYLGTGDYARCFYCDGGLCNWLQTDDPWTEHAKWYPHCEYVLLNKGDKFVDDAVKHHKIANPAEGSEEQQIALVVVNDWLKTDLVKQVMELKAYPIEIVKAALYERWREKQLPFNNFDEINAAVTKLNVTNNGLVFNSGTQITPPSQETPRAESSPEPMEDEGIGSGSPTSSPPDSLSQSPRATDEVSSRIVCKVCMDKEIGVVFLPCGHLVACTRCASGMHFCPICRVTIKGTVRAFFS